MNATITPVTKTRTVTDSYLVVEAHNEGQSYRFGGYEDGTYVSEMITARTEYSLKAEVKIRHGNRRSTWENAFILVYAVNKRHAIKLAEDLMTKNFGRNGWFHHGQVIRTASLSTPLK